MYNPAEYPARLEIDYPEKLDRLERRLIQQKIQREALKKEKDDASKQRLADLEETIEELEREFSDLEEIDFDELQDMQKAIEAVKQEDSQVTGENILQTPVSRGVSSELEERIKQELIERKKEKTKEKSIWILICRLYLG